MNNSGLLKARRAVTNVIVNAFYLLEYAVTYFSALGELRQGNVSRSYEKAMNILDKEPSVVGEAQHLII